MNFFVKQRLDGTWGVWSDRHKNWKEGYPILSVLRAVFTNETEARQYMADLITGVKAL